MMMAWIWTPNGRTGDRTIEGGEPLGSVVTGR